LWRTGYDSGRVSFVYDNCRVTVENGEYLTLEEFEPNRRDDCAPGSAAE